MKLVCGITVLVLLGGVAYAYLYPRNPTSGVQSASAGLTDSQKIQILDELAKGATTTMSESEKIKLLDSLK